MQESYGLFPVVKPELKEFLDGPELANGSSAVLYRSAFSGDQSRLLFDRLFNEVGWVQREVSVYGKRHLQPRLVAWYGDPDKSYTYAGLTLNPRPWIAPILDIKAVCEELTNTTFNSVLLNLYRNGDDTVGWHSDDEPELGPFPVIASVSLGASRRFDLRKKATKETIKVQLPAGSVLVMCGRTQVDWHHQLPRTKKVQEPRINLTFRQVNYG